MLENVPITIRDYIKDIQKGVSEYKPEEFCEIEDKAMVAMKAKDRDEFYDIISKQITKSIYDKFQEYKKEQSEKKEAGNGNDNEYTHQTSNEDCYSPSYSYPNDYHQHQH